MLSIIIPTLNEEELLPKLLTSIRRQKFGDCEIIVADAHSTDRTRKIAKKFGAKVVDGGLPAKGRNQGAKAAKRELLLFLDADNIYLSENFFEDLIKKFQKRNLGAAVFPIYPKGNIIDRVAYGVYNWWVSITQNFLPHATNSILVKKDVHEKIHGFDEEIRIGEDHDYVRRAGKVSKFGFIETEPVLTSPRRFERDGRIKMYLLYVLAGIWILIFGPIKSGFLKYRFKTHKK